MAGVDQSADCGLSWMRIAAPCLTPFLTNT